MPEHGDTKESGGLTWVYRVPPGTWVVKKAIRPLQRPNPDIAARKRREGPRD